MSNSAGSLVLSALSFETILDISKMYSLIFPLPWYLIVLKRCKSMLISALPLLAKRESISTRNCLRSLISSPPLKVSGMVSLTIIKPMRFERSHFS
ncbi:hypothetical protein YC2023_026202 [Brassica napus]